MLKSVIITTISLSWASIMVEPATFIDAPDCGQCFCSLVIGPQETTLENNQEDDDSLWDPLDTLKKIKVHYKDDFSRGIVLEFDNFLGGGSKYGY